MKGIAIGAGATTLASLAVSLGLDIDNTAVSTILSSIAVVGTGITIGAFDSYLDYSKTLKRQEEKFEELTK